MESWRERGFVPDSDDEDGFDSQDTRGASQNGGGGSGTSSAKTQDSAGLTQGVDGSNDMKDEDIQPAELSQDIAIDDHEEKEEQDDEDDDAMTLVHGDTGGLASQELLSEGNHVKPVEANRPSVEYLDSEEVTPLAREVNIGSSPSQSLSGAVDDNLSTPLVKKKRDIFDIPSSSPDALQLDRRPWRRTDSSSPPAREATPLPVEDFLAASSPLSSPLSSIRSPSVDVSGQQQDEAPNLKQTLEVVPPLPDIPDDILRELHQPVRRSLRERNPIQLHPYLLEDASYRKSMRERGVKPVRIAQYQEALRAQAAAQESQNQEFRDNLESPSASQSSDFRFPPSSPPDHATLFGTVNSTSTSRHAGQQPSRRTDSPSTNTVVSRSPKRRRVTKPGEDANLSIRRLPLPQVVIQNSSSPWRPENASTFDIPGPQRSVSSQAAQPFPEFKFPPGFSPPDTTSVTESKERDKSIERIIAMDEPDSGIAHDISDTRSASSESRSGSDVEEGEDNEDEAAIRRFQTRIKGVLPASWLRLDQQKQRDERLKSTQRDAERVLRMQGAKGVARIISKKAGLATTPSAGRQLSSLRLLADEDSDEESHDERDKDANDEAQDIASLFGLNDPFLDQDPGDILEDNRIDYMLPPASRNPASRNRKKVKKRPRLESNRTTLGGQHKKPRLNRQARLTDPIYGGRRKTQPARNLPKLGILDAPDVANQPRNEQPQFLRVAARKARSRVDRGRRSPSRKIFKLSSRVDTEDTNASLRAWRGGTLRQTTLPTPSQLPKRQPLKDLSTNKRATHDQKRKGATRTLDTSTRPSAQSTENQPVGISPPATNAPLQGDSETPPPRTEPPKPIRPEQRGNKWVVQRNFGITSLTRSGPRPAVPDIINNDRITSSSSSIQRSLTRLNKDFRQPGNLVLQRFLTAVNIPASTVQSQVPRGTNENHPEPPSKAPCKQLKKRPPKRLDITVAFDQETLSIPSQDSEPLVPKKRDLVPLDQEAEGLTGLRQAYTVDFNVSPLYPGIFFHESTFIGSGEFSRSLGIAGRDLDKSAGPFHIQVGDRSFRWDSWNDAVSTEMGIAFEAITGDIENCGRSSTGEGDQNLDNPSWMIYRSLVRYLSDVLSFIDPVDRTAFVTRGLGLVSRPLEAMSTLIKPDASNINRVIRTGLYTAAFANQLCQVSSHSLVSSSTSDEAIRFTKLAAKNVIDLISTSAAQVSLRKFFADCKLQACRDAGIGEGHPVVEAYVTVRHILLSSDKLRGCFEAFVAETYSSVNNIWEDRQKDIDCLEGGWQRLFGTLPLQEIDEFGIAQTGSRFKGGQDNWTAVNYLLQPALDSYGANSTTRPISTYKYLRVLFHRCFLLINGWGWRDCKSILDTLYDFFAKRTLYNLEQEESFKSPAFLDKLNDNPSFEVMPGDACFHILLKIIASGLRFLSRIYDRKKIRNLAWRLLPNHGRAYPKEQSVHQTDLDALRNHHDLLCTLYSSVPEGCRPRLEAIKNLVQPASSHRETCNISIRSWTRLARFKMSTNEDVSGLEPFADWHCYFLTELLKQHSLARKEVEAQNTGDFKFSDQLIERTIAQNQRQIESLLRTALQGLQGAVKSAQTLEHAQMISSLLPINPILGLFNPRVARLNSTVIEGLQVIVAYVQKCNSLSTEPTTLKAETHPAVVDEDSQEYGDWAAIEAVYGNDVSSVSPGVEHVEKVFHPAVSRLVSNCFGADRCPEDVILLSVVDCWTAIAQTLVRHGFRHWDAYLSPYEGDSWSALRWTAQTRKYTPQFLARSIEQDDRFLQDCKIQILGMWMSSLVERVSMLKFQHRLTEALLNQDPAEPVLQNLPFSQVHWEERYSITLENLSSRGLSLISCLLSNMRAHIQDLDDTESRELSTTRQEYRELIQKMMSSMKANYQELGNDTGNAQGAYVDFVHSIVGFLQQHTRDICPIDPFFTDPASFPLPSNDPTYIVARLKGYEPKLSSEKVAKTLIIFIQGVSERAALDGQQTYLVNQLHSSVGETYEAGNPDQPTLRAVLLQCVFPAYLEIAFDNPAAWVLSRPIIETTSLIFKDLLFNMNTMDSSCVRSILSMFNSIFRSSYKALQSIIRDANLLKEPSVIATTTAFLEMIVCALPVVDYIDRATDMDESIMAQTRAFGQFASFATTHLHPDQPSSGLAESSTHLTVPEPPTGVGAPSTSPPYAQEIRTSATRELQAYINESWSRHRNKYYFTRRGGLQPQEVEIEPSVAVRLENQPEVKLLDAARSFLDVLETLDLFSESGHDHGGDSVYTMGLLDLIE